MIIHHKQSYPQDYGKRSRVIIMVSNTSMLSCVDRILVKNSEYPTEYLTDYK
jgi:hypothetical protein